MRRSATIILRALDRRGLPEWLALGARAVGLAALAIAALSSWYRVPDFAPLGEPLRSHEPAITWLFRTFCIGVLIGSVAWTKRRLPLAAVLLGASLLYPTAVLHTAPQLAARVAWLWHQHDELTGYAGDIYTSQEVRDAGWHQRIVVVDEPIENRIVRTPGWNPANLEWGRTLEIAEWFGLSAWFSQGLSRGWVLAVAGSVLLLVAGVKSARVTQGRQIAWCGAVWVAALVIAALPFLLGAHFLSNARQLTRRGDDAAALAALHRAGRVLPALREDGAWLRQVGRIESALRRATPAAAFHRALRLKEDGFTQQARDAMLAELVAARPGSVEQRELVQGLLARAIAELNTGQPNPAMALLERIVSADPCHLKANYALQVACVRSGRLEELRTLTARMRETYRFLNTPTKRSVLAAAQEHLAAAELRSGTPEQALAHYRYARRLPK